MDVNDITEPTSTVIAAEEAAAIMTEDIVSLFSSDVLCPLARRIEDALAKLDAAITAHQPDA